MFKSALKSYQIRQKYLIKKSQKSQKSQKNFYSKIGQTLKKKTKNFLFKKLIHQSDAVGIHTRENFALGSPWLFLVTDP